MANDLTGDYDVVAEFSVLAVNRVLAAMHRGKRLPHSLSMAVDNSPNIALNKTVVSAVDTRGAAIADSKRIKSFLSSIVPTASILTQDVIRTVDPVINWRPAPDAPRAVKFSTTSKQVISPTQNLGVAHDSNFMSGVALMQLGAPTISLPQNRTDRAEIHTPAMIRYESDPNMRVLPEFLRGEIVTTFGVKETTSPAGTNIVVDLAGSSGATHFSPLWSDLSLDASDRAMIDALIQSSMHQTFQPSSTPMPPNIRKMHFKGLSDDNGVAVMMNVTTNSAPSPDSVSSGFLSASDHFAIAVNGDSIVRPFADAVNSAINKQPQESDTKVEIDYFVGTNTFHIFTVVSVLDATVELVAGGFIPFVAIPGTGQIRLTIPVQVRFGWKDKPTVIPDPVNFDFTIVQSFTLTLNGREVGLERFGDLAINIPGFVPANEANPARNQATTIFNNVWNTNQSSIQNQINKALSADGLQAFLKSLMNPRVPKDTSRISVNRDGTVSPQPDEVDPDLEYTNFEIRPSGIILRGSLAVPPWPAPHLEFEKDLWAPASRPEYWALNSWIPGGTIQGYEWSFDSVAAANDPNRFVSVAAPAITLASHRICLTFSGMRITSSGAIFYESVSAGRSCQWTFIPLTKATLNKSAANRPLVAVPKPGRPQERLQIEAHASPWAAEGLAGGTANFIVHFPEGEKAAQTEIFTRALESSGREDTATAILHVLNKKQVATARIAQGVMYSDDAAAWEKLLDIQTRPATVLVHPDGKVAWRHEGNLTLSKLTEAFRAHLAAGGQFFPQFTGSRLQTGDLPPNFVFKSQQGDSLTLRMLLGRPIALLFYANTSNLSLASLTNLQNAASLQEDGAPLIVAIEDGESGQIARKLDPPQRDRVVFVADPYAQIARAYGICFWPTIVNLDSDGIIRDIHLGAISEEELQPSVQSSVAQSADNEQER